MALMKSVSGIRGIFGQDLNPENLAKFTAAYGTFIGKGTVVVGRDSRVSGQLCEDIVVATLQSVGIDVVKVGIVPTPTVAMAVLKHNAQGGIIISASHNPGEWNALKLLNEKSEFLDADQGKKVLEIAEGEIEYKDAFSIGKVVTDDDVLSHHIEKILELPYINKEVISKAGFKVAVDAVNGAGSLAIPAMLKALGVTDIEELYCVPDGNFPHNPEPLVEHLGDICKLVKEKSCTIGFVVDPDADRLAIVGSNGELWGEEYTQAAAFDFVLAKTPGDCGTNLSSSRVADVVAEKYGKKCHRSAVGEINVVKTMQANNAVIGGEGNGGVINPDLHYGRDALVGVAMILQHLAELGKDSAEYRASLKDFYMSKNKISLASMTLSGDEVLRRVEDHYQDVNPNTIDGVKLDFENGWVHLRKSNTEPIIRIYSEGESPTEAKKLAQQVIDVINQLS